MANINETSTYSPNIYQLDLNDPVLGGTPEFDVAGNPTTGYSNAPIKQLADRTAYLKTQVDTAFDGITTLEQDFTNSTDPAKGAGLVGYRGRTVAEKLDEYVTPEDFGAVGDGIANDRAAMQMFFNAIKDGSRRGLMLARDYNMGALSESEKWAIHIDSPAGMVVDCGNARLLCTTTKIKDSIIAIKNPNNVVINNVRVTNPGFDIASTVGGGALRIGVYGIYLYATAPYTADAPCGDVYISGEAKDCIGFVSVTTESIMGGVGAVAKAIQNVTVEGVCERVYYGLTTIAAGENIRAKLDVVDVRRGAIMYSPQKTALDISLRCTPGFIGSNAFVEIACEGATVGNASDIDVRLRVSGVEAHEGLVTFYHIGDEAAGEISNVTARVTCNNLTTIGKAPTLGPLNVFVFFHTLLNGTQQNPTTRAVTNMDIDCDVIGSISGGAWRVSAVPDTRRPAKVGAGVFLNAPALARNVLWQYFQVVQGRQVANFTPVVFGTTTPGTATYTTALGEAVVVDGVCHFNIHLTWSAHTGVGNLRVGSLPFIARAPSTQNPSAMVECAGYGNAVFGNNTFGLITGNNVTITPYKVTSGALEQIAVPASGTLHVCGSYSLY